MSKMKTQTAEEFLTENTLEYYESHNDQIQDEGDYISVDNAQKYAVLVVSEQTASLTKQLEEKQTKIEWWVEQFNYNDRKISLQYESQIMPKKDKINFKCYGEMGGHGRCDELCKNCLTKYPENKLLSPQAKEETKLIYGTQVKCSMDEDYSEFWIGTYIAKHPTIDAHIVLCRARPELKISETLDSFTFVKPKEEVNLSNKSNSSNDKSN